VRWKSAVKTNAAFLARTAPIRNFAAGRIDTGFNRPPSRLIPPETPDAAVIAQAARALLATGNTLGGPAWVSAGGTAHGRNRRPIAGHLYEAVPASDPAPVWSDGHARVLFRRGRHGVRTTVLRRRRRCRYPGRGHRGADAGHGYGAGGYRGQSVKRGQILLVLEAMKMENALVAPFDGLVARSRPRWGHRYGRRRAGPHREGTGLMAGRTFGQWKVGRPYRP